MLNVAQTGIQQYLSGDNNGQHTSTAFIQNIKLKCSGIDIGIGFGLPIQPSGVTANDHSGVFPGSSGMQVVEVLAQNSARKGLRIGNPNSSSVIAWGLTNAITLDSSGNGGGGALPLDTHKDTELSGSAMPTNTIWLIGPAGTHYTVWES